MSFLKSLFGKTKSFLGNIFGRVSSAGSRLGNILSAVEKKARDLPGALGTTVSETLDKYGLSNIADKAGALVDTIKGNISSGDPTSAFRNLQQATSSVSSALSNLYTGLGDITGGLINASGNVGGDIVRRYFQR